MAFKLKIVQMHDEWVIKMSKMTAVRFLQGAE